MSQTDVGAGTALGCLLFWVAMVAAWITHVVYCITHTAWLLLIAGGIVFPVGVIHGVMLWFGAGWV